MKRLSVVVALLGAMSWSGCGGVEPVAQPSVDSVAQVVENGQSLDGTPANSQPGVGGRVVPMGADGATDGHSSSSEGTPSNGATPGSKGGDRMDPQPAPWTQKRDTKNDS